MPTQLNDSGVTHPTASDLSLAQGEEKAANKKSPQRKCVVSGESHDKSELLRFVRAPDGTLTFDLNNKLPGRGAYVTPDAAALQIAFSKNLFAKSFKDKTKTPPDMAAQITAQLYQSALQLLALARRAGDAVAGTEKAQDFAREEKIGAVILAADAGADSQQMAKKLAGNAPVINDFDRDALGHIFGREQAVVIAIRESGLKSRFLSTIKRYQALKGLEKHTEIA